MPDNVEAWPGFSESDGFEEDAPETESIATRVLDTYGIPYSGDAGGPLDKVDMKMMDAISAIKASLLEHWAITGRHMEMVVNPSGEVEFIEVDNVSGDISDRYYSIQGVSYKTDVSGVMVQGGDPLPRRETRDWTNLNSTEQGAHIHDVSDLYDNCTVRDLRRHAAISYEDPHLSSSYNDGIENLYEINDPFQKIVGYAYNIVPVLAEGRDDVTIQFNNTSNIPIKVGTKLGTLAKPPEAAFDVNCYSGWTEEIELGDAQQVSIPVTTRFTTKYGTTYDRFIRVTGVYILGYQCDTLWGVPIDEKSSLSGESTEANTVPFASINSPGVRVFKLQPGINYGTKYDTDGNLYIQFVDKSHPSVNVRWGDDMTLYLSSDCAYVLRYGASTKIEGASVLPLDYGTGVLVLGGIWMSIEVDMPSISIFDPKADALNIAKNFIFEVAPLILNDPPAPVAYNGQLLDMSQGFADHDPRTTQNFTDTEYELAVRDMSAGAGATISLSSLGEEECVTLSEKIYDDMRADNGVKTTHICGPNCNPQLGGRGISGGVINSISYSYTDGGSYTVSVDEGPKFLGNNAGITGGAYIKKTEEHTTTGTVLQDEGSHIMYKVLIPGLGVRQAINTTPEVIRTGDKVNVTVHNNPVET